MKRAVLTFGLISAALSIAVVAATVHFIAAGTHREADLIGYTAIVLSALLVFFGIRSYREGAGDGRLAFGRGVAVGVMITAVSSVCYVAAFQLAYFELVPGLGDKYAACMVDRARASGADERKLDEAARQAQQMKQMLDRPLTNAAVSFAETFPLGVVASLISAAILRRK